MSLLYIRNINGDLIPVPNTTSGSGGTGGTETSVIPGYWTAALADGVRAINAAVEAAGRNKSAFLWYTDAHWGYGSEMSPKLLAYLSKNTAIHKVNFGGDFGNDYEYPDTGKTADDWITVMRRFKAAVRDLPNHHSVIGNHDANGSNGKVPYLNGQPNHLYGFAMAQEETPNLVRGGDFCYYIDEPSEKTRYLYLNTSFCWDQNGYGEYGQGKFVTDALASTEPGWHIVAISHIWFRYASSSTPTVGSVPVYCQKLLTLFDQYNARRSGSMDIGQETVAYDFTGKGGKVEFCIGGHTHVDFDFTSDGGIPVILTRTDSYHWRDGSVNLKTDPGTTAEAAVNGIVADYDNNKISIIRIGKGQSREVALSGEVKTSYTNILETVGYKENTRLSASGGYTEKTQDGVDITGYIPVKFGDVLRFQNITIPQTSNGYDNEIYTFDSAKNGTASGDITDFIGTGSWAAVWENGCLVQLTYGAAAGYCRMNATHIDSTSIITINEEIN